MNTLQLHEVTEHDESDSSNSPNHKLAGSGESGHKSDQDVGKEKPVNKYLVGKLANSNSDEDDSLERDESSDLEDDPLIVAKPLARNRRVSIQELRINRDNC